MAKESIKLAETKIAKQLSAYTLIHYDMEFACRAFSLASNLSEERAKLNTNAYIQSRVAILKSLDPILKSGAAVAQLDANSTETETIKGALFEAAIVTYARCFNAGLRTSLSKKIFSGELSSSLRLHEKMMQVRNKHIAHSELKQERSIIGFQLVSDPAYGDRPSAVFSGVTARRWFPQNEDLKKLSAHCGLVDEKAVQPLMLKKAKALREQLLKMSEKEIEAMRNFEEAPSVFDPLFS